MLPGPADHRESAGFRATFHVLPEESQTKGSPGTMEDDQCYKDVGESIAVIGMSCRFPGTATSPQGLWEMIKNKNTAWSEIPPDRVNMDGFYHPDGQRQGSVSTLQP